MIICVSIVSHRQSRMVQELLLDLQNSTMNEQVTLKVVVTHNADTDLIQDQFSFELLQVCNVRVQGFGQNHNQAFGLVSCDYFVVMNPDIRIRPGFSWENLTDMFDRKTAVVAPSVISVDGEVQDNARKFPSPIRIGLRLFKRLAYGYSGRDYFVGRIGSVVKVEWVGGMFMIFKPSAFRRVGGFDPNYFMYVEDADICYRIGGDGFNISFVSCDKVVHEGQYGSRKKIRYFIWHIKSLMRFFLMATYGSIRKFLSI